MFNHSKRSSINLQREEQKSSPAFGGFPLPTTGPLAPLLLCLSELSFPGSPPTTTTTHTFPPSPPGKSQEPAALLRWLRKAHYLQPLRCIHFISAGRFTISTVAAHFIRLNFHPPPPPHHPYSPSHHPLFLIADKLDVAAASLKQINLTRSRNLLCPCRSRAEMMSLAEGGEWITAATWGKDDLRGSNLMGLQIFIRKLEAH